MSSIEEEEISFIRRYMDFQFYPCLTCRKNIKWEKLSKIIMLRHLYKRFRNYNIIDMIVNYAQPAKWDNFCSDKCMDKYIDKYKNNHDFVLCYSCNKMTRPERSFTLNMITEEGGKIYKCLKCVKYGSPKFKKKTSIIDVEYV
jgi:hypothetical protein